MSLFRVRVLLRSARRLRREENGASLLEMTVVAPVLLTFGLGVFEFSNALYQYHLISGGLRDAARFAAGLPMPDPVVVTDSTCNESDPRATPIGCAKRLAVTGQVASGGTNRVSWWEVGDIEVDYLPLDPPDPDLRGGNPYKVVVTTSFVYPDLGFLDFFGLGPINMQTAHEERLYGVR